MWHKMPVVGDRLGIWLIVLWAKLFLDSNLTLALNLILSIRIFDNFPCNRHNVTEIVLLVYLFTKQFIHLPSLKIDVAWWNAGAWKWRSKHDFEEIPLRRRSSPIPYTA